MPPIALILGTISCTFLLGGCAGPSRSPDSRAHLQTTHTAPPAPAADIPALPVAALPAASPQKEEVFSISVSQLPLRDLLFAIARDTGTDIDIHPAVSGLVTLHSRPQPLSRLLQRIARLVDARVSEEEGILRFLPDTPHLKIYPVDYVNLSRQVSSAISTSTQIAGNPGSLPNTSGTLAAGNLSSTRIDNQSRHQFWESLEKAIADLLRETDKLLPEGSSETEIEQSGRSTHLSQGNASIPPGTQASPTRSRQRPQGTPGGAPALSNDSSQSTATIRRSTFREAASVIVHPESGVLSVRATEAQHERVAAFLAHIMEATRRQVMIEATVVEVELNDAYRQGVDWSRLRADDSGFSVTRPASGGVASAESSTFSLLLRNKAHPLNLTATLDLLRGFGTTRVLSSPRLSVLNNQTALLKVVENIVYFSVRADTISTASVGTSTAVTTTPQSVSVGFVMSVTPQISASREITLNIRPSISSVTDWKQDPNPGNKVANYVPQIRTREMESVMRIRSGDIAVLGGLMEDGSDEQSSRFPGLGDIPLAGELLTRRARRGYKSELLIFLRPVLLDAPRLDGDFAPLARHLPDPAFFRNEAAPPTVERP